MERAVAVACIHGMQPGHVHREHAVRPRGVVVRELAGEHVVGAANPAHVTVRRRGEDIDGGIGAVADIGKLRRRIEGTDIESVERAADGVVGAGWNSDRRQERICRKRESGARTDHQTE